MTINLQNMTQAKWNSLSPGQRKELQNLSDLTKQLVGLEGWRVEAETNCGEVRRFYVSRSTGWRPCHIEVKRRDSRGGIAAEREYKSIRKLYRR